MARKNGPLAPMEWHLVQVMLTLINSAADPLIVRLNLLFEIAGDVNAMALSRQSASAGSGRKTDAKKEADTLVERITRVNDDLAYLRKHYRPSMEEVTYTYKKMYLFDRAYDISYAELKAIIEEFKILGKKDFSEVMLPGSMPMFDDEEEDN